MSGRLLLIVLACALVAALPVGAASAAGASHVQAATHHKKKHRRRHHHAPAPKPTLPLGKYQCYETRLNADGYIAQWIFDPEFFANGTYDTATTPGLGWHWTQTGNRINFSAGSFFNAVVFGHHVFGTYHPGGVAMPHAGGALAGNIFTLVLQSSQAGEIDPPATEFAPNPGGLLPSTSFAYCRDLGV